MRVAHRAHIYRGQTLGGRSGRSREARLRSVRFAPLDRVPSRFPCHYLAGRVTTVREEAWRTHSPAGVVQTTRSYRTEQNSRSSPRSALLSRRSQRRRY